MATFYTYFYRALHICSDPSSLSNELNYLKSLAVSRGYNPSVIDKALNKFKKFKRPVYHSDSSLNPIVLHFILPSIPKSLKFFHDLSSKPSLKLLTKSSSKFNCSTFLLFLVRTTVPSILFLVLLTFVMLAKQEDG